MKMGRGISDTALSVEKDPIMRSQSGTRLGNKIM